MTKKLDLAKTQFLFQGLDFQLFRRKRATVLFDNNGPIRQITGNDFRDIVAKFPERAKADGLKIKTVWTLEEITQ